MGFPYERTCFNCSYLPDSVNSVVCENENVDHQVKYIGDDKKASTCPYYKGYWETVCNTPNEP